MRSAVKAVDPGVIGVYVVISFALVTVPRLIVLVKALRPAVLLRCPNSRHEPAQLFKSIGVRSPSAPSRRKLEQDIQAASASDAHESITLSNTASHKPNDHNIGTLDVPSAPSNGRIVCGAFHFAGCNLGVVSSYDGLPTFSEEGRRWIQQHTGVENVFPQGQAHDLPTASQQYHSVLGSLVELVPKQSANSCVRLFLDSPLRSIFPILDTNLCYSTLHLAYQELPAQSLWNDVESARTWVVAFVALLSCLEPQKIAPLGIDAKLCAAQAERSILTVLASPNLDGLQATIILGIYRDFCGQLDAAAMLHSLACRGVLMFGGHIMREQFVPQNKDDVSALHSRRIRELFWLCYFFDKHISLRTGQPAVFDDNECDLTLPAGYTTFGDMLFSPSEQRITLYPSDLTLTKLKSKVFQTLYSRSGMAKSDVQLIADVYGLDVELEDWRLRICEPVRPSISKHTATAVLGLGESEKTLVTFIHFEYFFLLAAIHRACGRCQAWQNGGVNELNALRSSLHISVRASRSTLNLFKENLWDIHHESLCLYSIEPSKGKADMNLLKLMPRLIRGVLARQTTDAEEARLASINALFAEMIRLGECALLRTS
ncbi:hypothetical protein F4803DRAFT_574320 [Xylaria telfairii]|nr:hypothetical protein F4803DRAFT_574320 [Xylaria telfairii]